MREIVLAALLISYPPELSLDDYVYKEDPCVEALRGAMIAMEPFIPTLYVRSGDVWTATLQLTRDGVEARYEADEVWRESKLACFRH